MKEGERVQPVVQPSSFIAHPLIEVSAGLIFRAGQLLITQRPARGHLAGLWEFPGGKREAHETFEDCLRRELREELGVETHVHEELERLTHDYAEKSVHLRFFRCTLAENSPEPRAIECQALAWVTRETLNKFTFPAADERLLKLLTMQETPWR